MDFADAVKVLMRRWSAIGIGLVCILIAATGAFLIVSTNYEATGQVLLLPPSEPVQEGSRINPYLNLPAGLIFTASLIAGTVSTPDAQREMEAAGFSTSYSVSVAPGTGPLIVITVENTDPTAALATRDELISRIHAGLDAVQTKENVPEGQIIIAREFGVSQRAEVLAGSRIRAVAIIVALGTVLTAVSVFAIDRRKRRELAEPEPPPPVPQPKPAKTRARTQSSRAKRPPPTEEREEIVPNEHERPTLEEPHVHTPLSDEHRRQYPVHDS